MAESSGSDGSRPTSRGGSARAGEAFAPSAGAIVEEGEDARLGRLTIASTPPKNKRGGEKPPNTPPNKSPTNRSPMRSPTASRGGSVRAGGQQPSGGVRGILRRRESEDQVAEPTPAPAEDAAENGSVASSAPGAARSIDFDGLPAEDQEKSASPPRRHARLSVTRRHRRRHDRARRPQVLCVLRPLEAARRAPDRPSRQRPLAHVEWAQPRRRVVKRSAGRSAASPIVARLSTTRSDH